MTESPSRTLRYVAPLMLAITIATAGANWYFEPEKAVFWAIALAVLTGMGLVLWLLPRGMERAAAAHGWTDAQRRGVNSIRSAIVFASLMVMAGLSENVAAGLNLGGAELFDQLSKRGAMVLTGLFMAFTGNVMPKTLAPLAAGCDGKKTQAFQRLFGWTWTLMGLGYALVWLTLPIEIAGPASMTLVVAAILVVVTAMIRLWRTQRRDRTDSPARS